MTPKELYDWAVGMGAENCDIIVNGIAIDYYPPAIDHTIQTIEIKQPMIRWKPNYCADGADKDNSSASFLRPGITS